MGGMSDPKDRTVHATVEDGVSPPVEIVRYDLGGKWYWEQDCVTHTARGLISLGDAVEMAAEAETDEDKKMTWNMFRPGGAQFDRRLAKALGRD